MDIFYDTLVTFFNKQLEEFFDTSTCSIVVPASTASKLFNSLEAYTSLVWSKAVLGSVPAIGVELHNLFHCWGTPVRQWV